MKTLDTLLLVAYFVVNGFAVVQVIGSYRWPTVTRLVFCLLFLAAALVNTRTALNTPWVYQNYADYAIPLYSRFILGGFEPIITPMVLSIAVGQVGVAAAMFMKRRWFRLGCAGGIVFCLAISPLGLGAAFPATLLMALAFYRLLSHDKREPATRPDHRPIKSPRTTVV